MASPFVAELRLVSFNFAPQGWATCNGQLLAINSSQALFSLLGTAYGGNGIQNFGLPNLQGRTPIGVGSGFSQGQVGGEETHTLLAAETPVHTHSVNAIPNPGTSATNTPSGNLLAASTVGFYATGGASGTLNAQSVTSSGQSQAHENRQPYLVMNWIIALTGIFPSRG
jgi:microcystin-dependent protein